MFIVRASKRVFREFKRITAPPILNPTEELILWDFRKESTHREWFCVCDEDINGHSVAKLEPNGKGTGVVFHGDLSTQLPADGVVRYSGYCAIRSKFKLEKPKLFAREVDPVGMDLSRFDGIEIRVRGDGRRFIANLQPAPGLVKQDDVWQSYVITRGGPQWENIMLPFGDFFITYHGTMQDYTFNFPRNKIAALGLLLADRVNGPFRLEIQYIKAVKSLFTTSESIMP